MQILINLKALRGRLHEINNIFDGDVPNNDMEPIYNEFLAYFNKIKIEYSESFAYFSIQDYKSYSLNSWNNGAIPRFIADLNCLINILEGIELPSADNIKLSKEGIFFTGQYFDALLKMIEIIKDTKSEIILIDGYIDETVIKIFKEKKPETDLKILTKKKSENIALKTLESNFIKQYGSIKIKYSEKFHDRFLILNRKEYYHFGASIKDLGKRGFMFSLIEEDFIKRNLIAEFEKEWEST